MNRKPRPHLTWLYSSLYPLMQEFARDLGYALAVHGSLAYDMDLIAVPWVKEAKPPEKLVEAIRELIEGRVTDDSPEQKPHGRKAWTIMLLDGSGYVDLSVVCPQSAKEEGA